MSELYMPVRPILKIKKIITPKTEYFVANCDKTRKMVAWQNRRSYRETKTNRLTKESMKFLEANCILEIEVEDRRIAWSYVI